MKKLLKKGSEGLLFLIEEEIISFYIFFSSILAEIAFLWAHGNENALEFTILLLACIADVLISSYLEKKYAGTKMEFWAAGMYKFVFVGLFLIGILIESITALFLFLIPLAVTILLVAANNSFESTFCQRMTLILPMSTFLFILWQIEMAAWVKIVIGIAYLLLIPFMAIAEDYNEGKSVFELAYDFEYNKLEDESEEDI